MTSATASDFTLNTAAVMDIAPRPNTAFISGRGSWLMDARGKRYLDFVQGWAANTLGHCAPVVTGALIYQSSRLMNCGPGYFNEPMVRLAERLAHLSGLGRVFFANSGAEANEGAIKLARKWGAKYKNGAAEIITMNRGFHGRTLACMSASGKPQWSKLFEPKVAGFRKVPLNDLAAVKAAITRDTVAVMLEPIQGEAGVYAADDAYLMDLRVLTRERDVLLILDEVQTGIGRTGAMFGFQHSGARPDIMTLGKGLGGGVPLAALVASERVSCFDRGDQGGTFNGNPLMTAVGCAVVDEVAKPGFLETVTANGLLLAEELTALAGRHGLGEVRGQGLLRALDLRANIGARIVTAALKAGLLLNAPRPDTLRFMPALNVSAGEIGDMIRILDEVLSGL